MKIDKKEAIRRLKDHFAIHNDGRPTPYLDEVEHMAIEALEKTRWIPVTERLPEEGEGVFAVIGDEEQYEIDKVTYICEDVWFKDMLRFGPNEDVIAWMPIPKYKVEVK